MDTHPIPLGLNSPTTLTTLPKPVDTEASQESLLNLDVLAEDGSILTFSVFHLESSL